MGRLSVGQSKHDHGMPFMA